MYLRAAFETRQQEDYDRLLPKKKRRFTFTELRNRYRKKK